MCRQDRTSKDILTSETKIKELEEFIRRNVQGDATRMLLVEMSRLGLIEEDKVSVALHIPRRYEAAVMDMGRILNTTTHDFRVMKERDVRKMEISEWVGEKPKTEDRYVCVYVKVPRERAETVREVERMLNKPGVEVRVSGNQDGRRELRVSSL